MKVLDLQCGNAHGFEGWFASEDDFQSQLARSLVECPLCGDHGIIKKLSAPRLNLGATRRGDAPSNDKPDGESGDENAAQVPAVQAPTAPAQEHSAEWMKMARKLIANTEDVGERFADEARRIHYGEAKERGIRGQASQEQTMELLEEGIPVMPMAFPKALKETLQ